MYTHIYIHIYIYMDFGGVLSDFGGLIMYGFIDGCIEISPHNYEPKLRNCIWQLMIDLGLVRKITNDLPPKSTTLPFAKP